MQMMYETIYRALKEEGLDDLYEPQDYLNFFCLGNREVADSPSTSNSTSTPQVRRLVFSFDKLCWGPSIGFSFPCKVKCFFFSFIVLNIVINVTLNFQQKSQYGPLSLRHTRMWKLLILPTSEDKFCSDLTYYTGS